MKSRGSKPPKWEKEGDNLYVNHNQQQDNGDAGRRHPNKDITYEQARELLRPFESASDALPIQTSKSTASTITNDEEDHSKAEPPFLWGGLSVGPVWKSRLVQAGFDTPTPIQKASYHTLSNKKNQTSINGNAVIAASTGSGKSLAYLLPFLTSIDTNNRKQKMKKQKNSLVATVVTDSVTAALGKIWIVTPTMELAYQLQRVVDKVIVGDGSSSSNVLHVLEYNREEQRSTNDASLPSFSSSFPILSDLVTQTYKVEEDSSVVQEPTFLAGTPKLFVQLRKEIKKVLAITTKLESNLRYARQREARIAREAREGITSSSNTNNGNETNDLSEDDIRERLLYRKVAQSLRDNLETLILDEVDRLLQTTTAVARREYQTTKPLAQELLEALVWESKIPSRSSRYGQQPPVSTLQIVCASATIGRSLRKQLMYITGAPSADKTAVLITADVRTKKNADLRKSSLLPSNLKHSYQLLASNIEQTKEETALSMLEALVTTLQEQTPHAPSLVFPGTIGVEKVQEYLSNAGFRDIRGLSSLRNEKMTIDDSQRLISSSLEAPVYVVKERLARGLDLPQVRRVVLLGVPLNAAAYAHLAGRTARQNTPGECTVICKASDAYKLVSVAETLGLQKLKCLNDSDETVVDSKSTKSNDKDDSGETTTVANDWNLETMTKTTIKSKKVTELRTYLESRGVATKGLLKDSLVDAVLQYKERSKTSQT